MTRRAEVCRLRMAAFVGCALALSLVATGCNGKSSPTNRVGGSNSPKAEAARKQAEAMAVDAVAGAANYQAFTHRELVKSSKGGVWDFVTGKPKVVVVTPPPVPVSATIAPTPPPAKAAAGPVTVVKTTPVPRPAGAVMIKDHVRSEAPYTTEAEAEEDALRVAADRIEQKLRELSPPIRYRPSLVVVKNEYIRRDSRAVRAPSPEEAALLKETGYSAERVYVEYDIELTAEQVRELRSQDRVIDGLRVLGGVLGVAVFGFLFLRLDEWTKGYLTSWLGVGAALLAGGVAAALAFV